jgi:hypothetical protein
MKLSEVWWKPEGLLVDIGDIVMSLTPDLARLQLLCAGARSGVSAKSAKGLSSVYVVYARGLCSLSV